MVQVRHEKRITKRSVDAFSASGEKRERLWDTELKGFNVRAYPSGRKVYNVGCRIKGDGRYRWFNIGKHGDPWTPESARDEARNILAKASSGIDPSIEIADKRKAESRDLLKVAELIDLYLTEGPIDKPDKRQSSWDNDKTYLNNHARPLLGKRIVVELETSDMSKFQNDVLIGKSADALRKCKKTGKHRRVKGGRGAAVHAVRSFSAALGWAVKRKLIKENPCDHMEKMQDGVRERYLTHAEANALFTAIDDLLAEGAITQLTVDCITLTSYTAARVTEIKGLRWSEVDFERRLLLLPPLRHKTGGVNKPKAIPLADGSLDILLRRRGEATANAIFVFPSNRSKLGHILNVRHAFDKIVERAELVDFRVHDFRHAYASFALNAGESLKAIGANLGHKKQSTTERYAHLLVDSQRPIAAGVEAAYAQSRSNKS